MTKDTIKSFRIDYETNQMLENLAKMDNRSHSNEIETLIRQEYARRFSQPSLMTVAEAQAANEVKA